MFFIGIALLVAAGLALVVSADAGQLVGLSQNETARLIPLLLILIVIAGGVFTRRRAFSEMVNNVVLWAGLFAIAIVGYSYRGELSGVAARVMGELSPGTAVVNSEAGTARFTRSLGGSFHVQAEVNGAPVHFIFDTGASAVVLTAKDARQAGIDPNRLRFEIPVQTANGTGRAALVYLDRITVGGIERRNIRAFVSEPGALDTSLLGMSFLETLSGYAVRQESLILTD